MARIRTIKPDFWNHPKVGRVSRDARLLFLGLLNEADDEGRLRYGAKRLAGVIFPFDDDVGIVQIEGWADELKRAGLIELYEVDEAPLLLVCGFTEHQKVSHPSPSRLPNIPESSRNSPEDFAGDTESFAPDKEKEQGSEVVELALDVPVVDPVDLVFSAWQTNTGHQKAVLDRKRRAVIVKALKHYPVEDLELACAGVMMFPHNRGETNGHRYDALDLVLRDSEHIERFRDQARAGRPATLEELAVPRHQTPVSVCPLGKCSGDGLIVLTYDDGHVRYVDCECREAL